jgi:transmembrane sensor
MNMNRENDHFNKVEMERLADLLERYLADQSTDEEKKAIGQWYESLAGEQETSTIEELESKSTIWDKISTVTNPAPEERTIRFADPPRAWLRWVATIALFCLSGVVAYVFYSTKEQNSLADSTSIRQRDSQKNWVVKSNSTRAVQRLTLPDGSLVALQPGATVSYPAVFKNEERLIHFAGEAFFDIQRDETKPFKVVTGSITTRVLGTSFTVKAKDQSSVVEVNVRTGRVSVYEHEKADNSKDARSCVFTDGVILAPNQKVTYYKEESKWVTELVHDPLPVVSNAEKDSVLVFKDNLMRQVLQDVARTYSVEIMVANENIYECTFTGDVSQMELFDMLKVICRSTRATYEIRGTKILINGKGCNAQ